MPLTDLEKLVYFSLMEGFMRAIVHVTLMVTLLALMILIGVIATHAQSRPVAFNDHPQHASYVILATGGGVTVAQGEQTTGFPTSQAVQVSLGEVAREYRIEHESAPKSKYIWEGLCSLKTCCQK
jgi:hypothetical protein